ncbi:DUF2946 domain-containing protein [Acetobacter garciniae]|uniref:DUF2946 domain-containing protein n=1 Tax=Acetobacter garciniae TaxID=2817435 RepID=UPI002ED9D78A
MVLCVLLGLVGQLALQSNTRLGEAPRATFERLTGLHIGPAAPITRQAARQTARQTGRTMPAPAAMAGMSMPGMDMSAMAMPAAHTPDRATPGKISGADPADPAGPARGGQHHHHDDGYCPLCPLLHLPVVVLAVALALALLCLVLCGLAYAPPLPRIPFRGRIAVLPPATGPPAFV